MDQGIVTGLATSLDYLLTTLTTGGLDALAAAAVAALPRAARGSLLARDPAPALAVDLAVASAGIAAVAGLTRRPDESVARGAVRQGAWRATRTGLCGLVLTGLDAGVQVIGQRTGRSVGWIRYIPPAVPAGLALAVLRDRIERAPTEPTDRALVSPAPLQSVAASAMVVGALAGFAALDHVVAEAVGAALARVLPGGEKAWRLVGNAAFLGLVTAAGSTLFTRIVHGLEAGATAYEPLLAASVPPGWVGPTISGAPESRVPWATLGREGRRHAFSHVRARLRSLRRCRCWPVSTGAAPAGSS